MASAMGSLFYELSKNEKIENIVTKSNTGRRVFGDLVKRFVAGETEDSAIERAKELYNSGLNSTLHHLSFEGAKSLEDVAAEYLINHDLIEKIGKSKLPSTVAAKPSHFGANIPKEGSKIFNDYIEKLARYADVNGVSIEIDMEGKNLIDPTIELYRILHSKYPLTSLAIQANMKRTNQDVDALIEEGANIRLVKGAYIENPDVAIVGKNDIDENYMKQLDRLLLSAGEGGGRVLIATHDKKMIDFAEQKIEEYGVDRGKYEFAMLLGIKRKIADELVQRSHPVRIYVSYGSEWYPYLMRRISEKPVIAWHLAKSLVTG